MTLIWGSFALSCMSLLTAYLAGSLRRTGWIVGLGTQVLWAAYAIATAQYGFLFSVAGFTVIYLRNYLRWRRDGVGVTVEAPTPADSDRTPRLSPCRCSRAG